MQAQTNEDESNRHLFSTARSKVYDTDENISCFFWRLRYLVCYGHIIPDENIRTITIIVSVYIAYMLHEVSGNFIDT